MLQTINFRDPVVKSVVNKFVDRSDVGFEKYGKTLRDDQSDVFVWLNHLQEELMDATLYLQRLKEEISTLREEKMLLERLNDEYKKISDIDVVDAFEVRVKKKKHSKPENGRGDTHSFTIDEPIRFISDITNSHLDIRHFL